MTISPTEVITSVQWRLRWHARTGERLVAASLEPEGERFRTGSWGRASCEPAVQMALQASRGERCAAGAGRDRCVAAEGSGDAIINDGADAAAREPRHHRD
jgi:hypothetical protein